MWVRGAAVEGREAEAKKGSACCPTGPREGGCNGALSMQRGEKGRVIKCVVTMVECVDVFLFLFPLSNPTVCFSVSLFFSLL